ncbi:MAG: PAS domain-containing protein [Deltaproteobacteria bacterium]|nr:PAS domain-containing protein [Deltaproteobacteria bacterium]
MSISTARDRLLLLNLFRVLVAVVLLVATFLFGGGFRGMPPWGIQHLLYHATGAQILLCLLFSHALERAPREGIVRALGMVQLVGDTVFASVLVLITGGLDSVFTFFYSLFIINASIVLYWTGALVTALSATVTLTVVALVQRGVLTLGSAQAYLRSLFPGEVPEESASAFVLSFATNIIAFYAVAFLSSFLAEQVREADRRLSIQRAGHERLRRLHQNIIQSLENGLITLDPHHRVTYVNRWALEWLGLSLEDLSGLPIFRFFPDLGPILTNPDKSGRAVSETTLQVRAGRKTSLRWAINPLRDTDGVILGRVVLFWDVTDVVEMEKAVERGARMATIGRLAASIAHEIRNPLASMSGSIQLLRSLLRLEGDEDRLMDIVVHEAEHLNRWITEFLAYARPRKLHLERVDLGELCREVSTLLSHDPRTEDLHLAVEVRGDPVLNGDVGALRQVIWNLATNAVDASSPGGPIALRVDGSGPDGVILEVEDRGAGIPPEIQERIFDPFFSTKEMGTGLGLATVLLNVEQHRGQLRVSSEPGKGTTFRVVLGRFEGGMGT